jgi:predicted nucleic acid-binding protein
MSRKLMMSETGYLFDTGALIDIYRGRSRIQPYFKAVLEAGGVAFVSVISEAELWQGLRPDELSRHEALLRQFNALPITSEAARQAGVWMQLYKTSGLGWMDALMVSTAYNNRLVVLTRDRRLASLLHGDTEFMVYD